MSSPKPKEDPYEPVEDQYTVGWICAIQEEYEVACKMLDRRFKGPRMSHPRDDNTYEFGQISDHHVVIGCLPFGDYGTNSAAAVARDMVRSFPKLRFALLVGIGGGAPTKRDDIRLGDVVVGASKGIHGGIVQLDAVKRHKLVDGSISTQFWRHLNGPPNVLLGALPKVQERYNDPDLRILCFEMEAAGLVNTIPCLVIRGICDYADSHKNDEWHKYAALAAAAYTRELLHILQAENVTEQPSWNNVLDEDREDRRNGVALSWIAADSDKKWHDDTHVNYYSKRHHGTGYWFENHPEFLAWVGGQARTLLCHGPPGAGKSVIAAIAINYLLCEEAKCAYLYCNYGRKDSVKQTATSLLSVLLRQLCETIGLPNLIRDCPHYTLLSLQEVSTALLEIIKDHGHVFIVIDALDECLPDVRETLLETMIGLQDRTLLRVMATSRGDFRSIQHRFTTCSKIEIEAMNRDVQAFIQDGIKHIRHLGEHSPLRDDIPRRVAQAAGSLFLVAKFQLESLRNTDTEQDVDNLLGKLSEGPKGLKRVYDESIERIDRLDHTQRHRTYSLLSWIFNFRYEYAPGITVQNLGHALSVQEGDIQFNQKNIPDVHSVISRCGGLVSIKNPGEMVEFAHETAQQYFKDNPNIFEKNLVTQRHIALTCITYLSCVEPPQSTENGTSFYVYAANSWAYHVRHADPQTEVDNLILDFLQNETRLSSSIDAMIPSYNFNWHSDNWLTPRRWFSDTINPKKVKGLHLAAYFGLKQLANYLLENGANIEAMTWNGRTPLHYAVSMNHDEMVRLLVQRGADVNTKDSYSSTPLHRASNLVSKPLMEFLIQENADIYAQDRSGDTSLNQLVKGIDLGRHFRRKSHVIAKGDECMELLIKSGMDLNFQGRLGRTALYTAIALRNEILVKQLLDAGAALDTDTGVLALSAKEENKLYEACMIVLEYIAAVPVQRDRFAVYTAAIKGQHDEVERLLDMDKPVIETDGMLLQIALSHSARKGHYAVVQVLLEAGVDCNAADHGYELALLEAAQNGHDAIVRILLKAGADVETKTKFYPQRTALYLAAEVGDEALIHTLMASGANIHERCALGHTPLDIALLLRRFAVVRLLRGNRIPVSRRRKQRASDDLIQGIQNLKI